MLKYKLYLNIYKLLYGYKIYICSCNSLYLTQIIPVKLKFYDMDLKSVACVELVHKAEEKKIRIIFENLWNKYNEWASSNW
jgi:hypothetical protein